MTITQSNLIRRNRSRGLTLIELLVVVAIMAALTAVMIPRMRIVNKDRGIREAARIVASAFGKASNRAVDEGIAGIIIESNPNFIGDAGASTDVRYAGTTIYQLRRVPPYIGDDFNAKATSMGATVTIPKPLEYDAYAGTPKQFVQRYDYISFNGSSYRYLIQNVAPTGSNLNITLDLNTGYAPQPQLGATGVPFVIHRQPQKLESSRVDLPAGHMIDLRYSGPVVADPNAAFGTAFNQQIDDTIANANQIRILFGPQGGVDRFYFYNNLTGFSGTGAVIGEIPQSTLYWFVSAYETEPGIQPIDRPSNMWVTLNHLTGSVNVASTAPPTGAVDADGDGSLTFADRILEARQIAITGRSATQ